MAGQAWKYSGQLNERDLAFLQHQFITIPMGIEYYGFSERPLVRMAKDAGAYYKIGKMVRQLGEKFVERQNEREEVTAEKDEKPSIIDDLKAKKEEVAKIPKKDAIDKGAKAKGGEAL